MNGIRSGIPIALLTLSLLASAAAADVPLPVPKAERSNGGQYEHSGQHDANNLRTLFYNFGMVGDFQGSDVDLTSFHSVEVPRGTGMNYSDGITPFVLVQLQDVVEYPYIMETGYRERQAFNALTQMIRFEPRPGYFQSNLGINQGRSVAMSHDERTWPDRWPDKLDDVTDPGWPNSWDGYFGKRPAADQESFTVMDDDMYDYWFDYFPDSTDDTRRGLGLRVEVRGFQWENPQAGNVIFWHYDITNEGTVNYDNNVIFGLYMDSGVGGSALSSCNQNYESDDDNAYFDKSFGLNLVYTWDNNGNGVDLASRCAPTGYLGYAYLETPGNPFDGADNDNDGIVDEARDSGKGFIITGRDSIRDYVNTHYDMAKFVAAFGPLENRPAYRAGRWWTGDEDLDWSPDYSDVGVDGIPNTHDVGEGDGEPTAGEPAFDRTDVDESDLIGLTGFKMNRIGPVSTSNPLDHVVFFELSGWDGPRELYAKFTASNVAARFDSAVALNYNIGFFFASGPFQLRSHLRERFSLALGFGDDLFGLRETIHTVQLIYNANYQFAVSPTLPTVTADVGDHKVMLAWDDAAELSPDPVTNVFDFEGYRVYRSTDPDFRDKKVLVSSRGNELPQNGDPDLQLDLKDGIRGNSRFTVDGVAYFLGNETGIRHYWTDTTAVNGQLYYYAVTAYDFGSPPDTPDSLAFFPSENAITVSRTPRGGVILPRDVVAVRPEPKTGGWTPPSAAAVQPFSGTGSGTARVEIVNPAVVPDGHLFKIGFAIPAPDSIRATSYSLIDDNTHRLLFKSGFDLDGEGIGPTALGLLPIVGIPVIPVLDSVNTHFTATSSANVRLKTTTLTTLERNLRRPGYPDNITITFDSTYRDTSQVTTSFQWRTHVPAKFFITAHTDSGDRRLRFLYNELAPTNGTLDKPGEFIWILTDAPGVPVAPPRGLDSLATWEVKFDTSGVGLPQPVIAPTIGDVFELKVRHPYTLGDTLTFTTVGQRIDPAAAKGAWSQKPYVVPNPYLGSASFEPARFATSGRGERRVEFRALPLGAVVRIYTVHGDLVQTLRQDGSNSGFTTWNLRTKDNLDVAPGLYIFHVDAPGLGEYVGKFAVIK